MENKIEIVSNKCVNSNWKARFLCDETEESCQCSFGKCKVQVSFTHNGHKPYTYILTESELEQAKKVVNDEVDEVPQFKGTLEALDNLTIRK